MASNSYDLALKFFDRTGSLGQRKIRKFQEDNLYREAVAWKAETVFNKEKHKTTSLIQILGENYGFKEPADIDRIILASQAIDRLRALGLSDKEIAKEFGKAEYDPESISFPILEHLIKKLTKNQGMSSLEELDTKVDLMRIEKEIHLLEAAKIAREELEKLAENPT